MIYIEKYSATNECDVEKFLSGFAPGIDYQQTWPIVMVSGSRKDRDAFFAIGLDYHYKKLRTKPGNCANGGVESMYAWMVDLLGMRGMTYSTLSACTSGAYALFQGWTISKCVGTPVVVVCADIMSDFSDFYFRSIGALHFSTGIPFDKNSIGFRPGQGQAFFVVSAEPINPVASISTMRFLTQPNIRTGVGDIDEINQMFDGVDISNVGWWNAHAPGTQMGDKAEYELFKRNCPQDIPITSFKGWLGHSLASNYMIELGWALKHLENNHIKGNVGIQEPINSDPRIIQTDVSAINKKFVKFSLGFGGKYALSVVESFS